ncbi:MAG: glycosyltransferase family 4 protein [Verrucomicrobiales bacterium]|nr:glycosyltransferase family 4 protein [Verrucomicrobiales bacterium]
MNRSTGPPPAKADSAPPPTGVLVFAHTPPPHHGQSVMVAYMLDQLRTHPNATTPADPADARRLRVFHVNARLSREIDDVGRSRPGKLPVLLGHVLQALWWRCRHAIRVFYYVPAPPARTPLWRDWIVLALCRPFFARTVFHWHAGGLSEWLETQARPWERWLSQRLLGQPHLSIVLRPFHRRDADYLRSRRVAVVANGLSDPCPDFDQHTLPLRRQAAARRRAALAQGEGAEPVVFRALFLSVCRREKGLFEALDAVAEANAALRHTPLRVELTVAGSFASPADQAAFERRVRAPDLTRDTPLVHYAGFVRGDAKTRLLTESDCLCFPTWLPEGFPLTLLEAMAYGLPVLCSDFRALPEILPPGYPGIVPVRDPSALAAKLVAFTGSDYDPSLRRWYAERYSAARFAAEMRAALLSV